MNKKSFKIYKYISFIIYNLVYLSCLLILFVLFIKANQTSSFHRHTCNDIDECISFQSHCPQNCDNLKGNYKCSCSAGFVDTHGDGSICEAVTSSDSVVLFAYGSEIRQIRTNYTEYLYSTLIENEKFVRSLDVDPVDRYFYWIDQSTQLIKRSYLPNTKTALGKAQVLTHLQSSLSSGLAVGQLAADITALAIDWIGKNIYFADASGNGSIKVAKNDGRYLKTIITQNANLVNSLVVNPLNG